MDRKNTYWKPEIGDEIQGVLIEKLSSIGRYENKLYKIKTRKGVVKIWGKKHLDSLMEATNEGDYISIKFVGTDKVNGHDMHCFELEFLNDNYV